jgi:DNA-binding CsgD family transcriptional regulator
MIRSDEQWLSIIDAFHSAAIGAQRWETALRGFADVTGSRSAQLTGVGQDGSVLFNALTNKAGRLQACWPEETKALNDAIEAAVIWRTQPGPAVLRTVVVRRRDHNTAPLVLDVFPLSSQAYRFNFAPRVLVVARSPRGSKAKRAAILRATYALTPAEIQITEYLAEGQSAELTAAKRGVAVETVRTQIKAIMAKLGVSRQVELAVRLSEL